MLNFLNRPQNTTTLERVYPPPPPPKNVAKIHKMLTQVEIWINAGEKELVEKHWDLISQECRKYGTQP